MEVRNLAFSYNHEGPPLISDLTFSIGRRDRIGVIGKNGRGKTTLLSLLAGELAPSKGLIGRSANLEIGYFGQANIDRLEPELTIEEELIQATPDASRGLARTICGTMLFDGDNALKKISVLSGGEKSRVLLGKMLVRPTNLLVLDEPTNHLDMESVDSLVEAVEAFDGAAVLATHSEMILHAMAERLIVFDGNGAWLFEGTYQDFLDRVGWQDEEAGTARSGRAGERKELRTEKRELKRMRAELITERSRSLSPLEREIARIEKAIIGLEEQMRDDNMALIRASQVGEGRAISALSISIHEAKKTIEGLFGELEVLSGEHHRLIREFDAKLEELGQRRSSG
jgi:ATP-binding cassette subfamily F protein 3